MLLINLVSSQVSKDLTNLSSNTSISSQELSAPIIKLINLRRCPHWLGDVSTIAPARYEFREHFGLHLRRR
jgi:hypothetical protein